MSKAESVSKEQLVEGLRSLGVQSGDILLFHSSLKSIGWVDPGPEAVIEAFLEVLGPDGTLVAPAMISALNGIRPLFDVKTSPSEMGLLTETVRNWPGARRSNHPTHSIAAIGPLAEELTANHRQAWGPVTSHGTDAVGFDSPWDRMYKLNVWILLIGVSFGNCTMLHHAQVRYAAKHQGITAKTPWPDFDFHKMGDYLDTQGSVKHGTLGNAPCLLTRARDVVDCALNAIEERLEDSLWPGGNSDVTRWLDTCSRIETHGRPTAAAFKVNVVHPSFKGEVGRPLHMRGMLIDHPQDGRVALLVWDHGAVLPHEGDTIRRAVAEAAGVPFERILLTATHTHSSSWWAYTQNEDLLTYVARTVSESAAAAVERLEPVRAGWTSVRAPGINRNRTVYLKDGTAYTERWAQPFSWHIPEEQIKGRGPTDEDLRLLVLERLDGSRLAVAGDFSCHNSAALKDPRVTDDFFGVAMEIVEQVEGNSCVVLCTPGSEGDQDPTALVELGGTRDCAYARKLGTRLAGYFLAGTAHIKMHDVFRIGAGNVATEVGVRDDWRTCALPRGNPELGRWAEQGRAPAEVSAIAIGEFGIVGIPAEFVTTPARRIREHSPFKYTAVAALTNGTVFYVAEKEAFFEGSLIYGVHANMAAMAEHGSDRILSDAGIHALHMARRSQSGPHDDKAGEEG